MEGVFLADGGRDHFRLDDELVGVRIEERECGQAHHRRKPQRIPNFSRAVAEQLWTGDPPAALWRTGEPMSDNLVPSPIFYSTAGSKSSGWRLRLRRTATRSGTSLACWPDQLHETSLLGSAACSCRACPLRL